MTSWKGPSHHDSGCRLARHAALPAPLPRQPVSVLAPGVQALRGTETRWDQHCMRWLWRLRQAQDMADRSLAACRLFSCVI